MYMFFKKNNINTTFVITNIWLRIYAYIYLCRFCLQRTERLSDGCLLSCHQSASCSPLWLCTSLSLSYMWRMCHLFLWIFSHWLILYHLHKSHQFPLERSFCGRFPVTAAALKREEYLLFNGTWWLSFAPFHESVKDCAGSSSKFFYFW